MRSVLAVVAGVVVAGLITFLAQAVGRQIYPPPPGMNPMDPASIRAHLSQMPTGAFAAVLVSWALGTLGGGWTAAKISRRLVPAIVVGVIQLVFGVINMVMIPSPVWFYIVGCLLFVPSAYLGGKLARPPA
jgi:hypothetical protein